MSNDILLILPLIIVVVWACGLLIGDLFIPAVRKTLTALLAAIGLGVALVASLLQVGEEAEAFGGMVAVDGFSTFLTVILLLTGLGGIALSLDYLKRNEIERGEFYVLLLFSVSGMMLMTMAADLIVVFLALEWLSIPLYVMAGFALPRSDSEEAAMKYFLLGAFASGFLVFGVALVFGATATTSLVGISEAIEAGTADLGLLAVGAGLFLVGLGFKVAAVPFHMWTPDVYVGAPTSVTGFMAVGAKVAGFAALLRVFVMAFPPLAEDLTPVLWVVAALTLLLGNIVAIAQRNIKRMLAYSSIAHAGYILMAIVPYGEDGLAGESVASALFYLLGYAVTSFGVWAVVISLERSEGRGLSLDDYAGLGKKYPLHALAMAIFMLSFTGVPPTIGFVAKFYVFSVVVQAGFIGLALIGVVTSVVSAYYYLRVVMLMYMRDGEPEVHHERWLNGTTAAAAIFTVLLILFSATLFSWAVEAAQGMLS
jgi:NADH-quinone oxidoreductase subunit N